MTKTFHVESLKLCYVRVLFSFGGYIFLVLSRLVLLSSSHSILFFFLQLPEHKSIYKVH